MPLGAKPYLWVSQLILVTPLRVKSNGVVANPARARNGIRNEPRQASTWSGIRLRMATRDKAAMSSMIPCGKVGAEPTRIMVLVLIRREKEGIWTL